MDDTTATTNELPNEELPNEEPAKEETANDEFSERRDFVPVFPPHENQAARLLSAVLLGKKVDPLWGWSELGVYRLADAKFRLNKLGWPMEKDDLVVRNKFGEGCCVALYWLPQWAIDVAGEHGREFARVEMELMSRQRAA